MISCIAALFYFFGFGNNNNQDSQNNITQYQIQPLPSPTIPAGENIQITSNSGAITVKNFILNSLKIVENVVYISENPNYSILYFSNTNSFLISLFAYTAKDANLFRSAAEQELLLKLGIGPEVACKLKISQNVPNSYNPDLSSTDFGFSYCNNGIEIPTQSENLENTEQNILR
jgi:hypothetical protein